MAALSAVFGCPTGCGTGGRCGGAGGKRLKRERGAVFVDVRGRWPKVWHEGPDASHCVCSGGVAVGASNGALGCLRVCRSCVVVSVPGGGTLNCGDGPSYPSWATPSQLYISDQTRMGATVDAFENLDRGYERGCVLFGAVSVLRPGGALVPRRLPGPASIEVRVVTCRRVADTSKIDKK